MMSYIKGKGAQIHVKNPYANYFLSDEDKDGLDEDFIQGTPPTQVYLETPKTIISKNRSPDMPFEGSINPYQGCEHGCTYCYARNSHAYWGFDAGLDFESKIIIKKNAAQLLEKEFLNPNWKPNPILLSGNTDCYQPLERKYKLTRQLLEVFLKYRHPVVIITKNAMVTRDLDIISQLATYNLVQVVITINTLNENLRRMMEPRTASVAKKFLAIQTLSKANVPVGVMNAPVIPGLNHHEIPNILKKSAACGASFAAYTVVRLNGQIGQIFKNWLEINFPDSVQKVWNQIKDIHGGSVNDSRFGKRMSGEGQIAKMIQLLFQTSKNKYFINCHPPILDTSQFLKGGNLRLF